MATRKTKGPIVWKPEAQLQKPAQPRRHQRDEEIIPEVEALMNDALKPGALFQLIWDMVLVKFKKRVTPPPFPVLEMVTRGYDNELIAKQGGVAMYAGSIRVEEEGRQGILRVVRHTFIIGTGRYIINNVGWLKPVT